MRAHFPEQRLVIEPKKSPDYLSARFTRRFSIRDLSETSRGGGGGVENRGGSEFFEPSKREGYEKKMTGKEGGSRKNKPPRS